MKNRIKTYNFNKQNGEEVLADLFLWDKSSHHNFEERHAHSFNELFIFKNGNGNHLMSDSLFKISEFAIHFLPSHFIHQMNRTNETEGFTIAFSDPFLNQLQRFEKKINYLTFFSKPFIINLEREDFEEFNYYFHELAKFKEDTTYFLNLLSLLLLKTIKLNENLCTDSKNLNFENTIIKLINDNYKQKPKSKFYSEKLNISATTLNRKVVDCFGKTISQLQNDKIIQEVKHLLEKNELSIKQIAFNMQFNDQAHLSVFFKQHAGVCPSEFKKVII